jgi:hypothetical protein
VPNNGLAALVHMNVLDSHLLLAFPSVFVESFEQRDERPR